MQADKEQPRREGHTSSNIVQRLGMVHLAQTDELIHEAAPLGTPVSLLFPLPSPSFPSQSSPKLWPWGTAHAGSSALLGGTQGRWGHLKVANHYKAGGVGAAHDERCGVNPGVPALLQELPIPQDADQGHWGRRAWLGLAQHLPPAPPARQLPRTSGCCPFSETQGARQLVVN